MSICHAPNIMHNNLIYLNRNTKRKFTIIYNKMSIIHFCFFFSLVFCMFPFLLLSILTHLSRCLWQWRFSPKKKSFALYPKPQHSQWDKTYVSLLDLYFSFFVVVLFKIVLGHALFFRRASIGRFVVCTLYVVNLMFLLFLNGSSDNFLCLGSLCLRFFGFLSLVLHFFLVC